MAAEGGNCVAQLRLAEAIERDELGLVTDEEEALKWHRKAAEDDEREENTSCNADSDSPTRTASWAS